MLRELQTPWRKSAECGNGECVEVAAGTGFVLVRNSRTPDAVLEFTAAEWAAFARGMRAGEFNDLATDLSPSR